jgi:plastocyanin
MRWKTAVAGIAVVVGMAGPGAGPAGAGAAGTRVVAGPGGASAGYLTRVTAVKKGTRAFFRNLDIVAHDVIAVQRNGSGAPLFRSALVGLNKEAEIFGVSALPVGAYQFFCSLHTNMKGTLRVIK